MKKDEHSVAKELYDSYLVLRDAMADSDTFSDFYDITFFVKKYKLLAI